MRNYKLGTVIGLLILTVFTIAIGLLIGRVAFSDTQRASAQMPPDYLAATPQNLEYLGLNFTQIDASNNLAQGAIKQEQAITIALNQEPGLKAATVVSAMLGYLRDTNLQKAADQGVPVDLHLTDMGLVWLVTFHGIETSSSGPATAPRNKSNEYNVVIDAKTGKYVMAFPLFDITPNAPANIPVSTRDETPLPSSDDNTPVAAPTFIP